MPHQTPFNWDELSVENDAQSPVIPGIEESVYSRLEIDHQLIDGHARWQAVDPSRSFIVQAPAGSGKTSLLSQRFLVLLSQVEKPEQIVAMTFTKKAAAEMRRRILELLQQGAEPLAQSTSLVDRNNWHLAQAVLRRDQAQNWQLLKNPNRLRIKTIDGMNGFLAGQMPLLSKLGASSKISTQPERLYQQAVRQCFQDDQVQPQVAGLLRLVNGRITQAENLLIGMLAKRDQWMATVLAYQVGQDEAPHVTHQVRQHLQASLQVLVDQELNAHRQVLTSLAAPFAEICQVAEYSQSKDQPQLAAIANAWPFDGDLMLQQWQCLADWILTKDSKGFRKPRGLNKNNGFPPEKGQEKQWKQRMQDALQILSDAAEKQPEILTAVAALKTLPEPIFTDQQWHVLQHILQLLALSVGYLKLCFQQSGEVDFIEVAQAASEALGSELAPTDLAQQLDYQIHHLLIDEFQDTSSEQYRLLNKLVAGWQPDEGRTLFIVGDPMQSIYRFREAEVGNFLKAWQGKVADVTLTPLNLQVNFRSNLGVVNWVNQVFAKIFPSQSHMSKGAVRYSESRAFSQNQAPAVFEHFALERSAQQEAQQVVAIIEQALHTTADAEAAPTIAVLGRNRSHLALIAGVLKQRQIAFRAVELESLAQCQEVQDVLALTRAFLHQADRAAWIALLRSPMIGLSLKSLQQLIGSAPYQTVWQLLQNAFSETAPAYLSAPELARLQQLMRVMPWAWKAQGTTRFAQLIRELWWVLDGPVTLGGSAFEHVTSSANQEASIALENVEVFLQALEQQQQNSDGVEASLWTPESLQTLVDGLYARAAVSEQSRQVELMTMHKSKGLEFDTVILPGLQRKPRADDAKLLNWLEFSTAQKAHFVMAPLDQKGQQTSGLTELLKRFEKEKAAYEVARLFYVAATRAKRQLHLFASVAVKTEAGGDVTLLPPSAESIFACWWPLVQPSFTKLLTAYEAETADQQALENYVPKVKRLPAQFRSFASWQSLDNPTPKVNSKLVQSSSIPEPRLPAFADKTDTVESSSAFHLSNIFSTVIGDLVHRLLQQVVQQQALMTERGLQLSAALKTQDSVFFQTYIQLMEAAARHYLVQQGVANFLLNQAWQVVETTLYNSFQNAKVCWALLNSHRDSKTEWAMHSSTANGQLEKHIIDRSFIDEHGVRWILDYKTSHSLGEGVAQTSESISRFIESQTEFYRPQLQRYAELLKARENRPQKCVLYFAYFDQWVEW